MRDVLIVQNSIRTTYLFRVDYIKKLLSIGVKVTVIAPNDCNESYELLVNLGVNIYLSCPMCSKIKMIISIIQLNYYIANYRFRNKNSIIVCHFLVTYLFCIFSLAPFNNKLVVSIEGLGSLFLKKTLKRWFLTKLILKSPGIKLFCNRSDAKLLGDSKSIVFGGIGITKHDKSINVDGSDKTFRLLYVGRLINDKGVNDAIESFRKIRNERTNVILSLVGEIYPSNPSSLSETTIRDLRDEFGSSIEFVGFTHDVLSWYLKSHILLLPSKREGFPVCVMEANMCGIPAVCYDVPGCQDAIVHGVNGFLAKQGDIEDYTEKVLNLLNFNLLNDITVSSKKYAINHFDNDIASNKFISLLKSL